MEICDDTAGNLLGNVSVLKDTNGTAWKNATV